MDEEGFVLAFQPIYLPRIEKIYGYECLLRIGHKELGLLPASAFMPTVKKYPAFSRRVEEWTFRELLGLSRTMGKENGDVSMLSINVDTESFFAPDFLDRVEHELDAAESDSEIFCLEFQRDIMSYDEALAEEIILAVRSLGLKVAIDNADAALIRKGVLAVDMLKIDRKIINAVLTDRQKAADAKRIIDYTIDTGIEVCALGVESAEQERVLLQMGCDKMQGYYYDLPLGAVSASRNTPLSEYDAMCALIDAFYVQGRKSGNPIIGRVTADEERILQRNILYEMPDKYVEIIEEYQPPVKPRKSLFRRK